MKAIDKIRIENIQVDTLTDQAVNAVQEMLESGELGEPIPPERSLAKLLGISRVTMRRAMAALKEALQRNLWVERQFQGDGRTSVQTRQRGVRPSRLCPHITPQSTGRRADVRATAEGLTNSYVVSKVHAIHAFRSSRLFETQIENTLKHRKLRENRPIPSIHQKSTHRFLRGGLKDSGLVRRSWGSGTYSRFGPNIVSIDELQSIRCPFIAMLTEQKGDRFNPQITPWT